MIVYLATNKVNGKCYVGITSGSLQARINRHVNWGPNGRGYFQKAIHKYGIENFSFEIIDGSGSWELLCKKEMKWIKNLNTLSPNGYNLTLGGEGSLAGEELKARLSKIHTGRVFSKTHRENLSKSKKGKPSPLRGRSLPQDVKDKIGTANKGRKPWTTGKQVDPKVADKIRKSLMGHKVSAATRLKISQNRWGYALRSSMSDLHQTRLVLNTDGGVAISRHKVPDLALNPQAVKARVTVESADRAVMAKVAAIVAEVLRQQ